MGSRADKLAVETKEYVGKNWSNASETREKLLGNLERIGEYMAGQGLQEIADMKSKHVQAFFAEKLAEGLAKSTLEGYATAMRELAHAIGKNNIMPRTNAELGIHRPAADRFRPAAVDQVQLDRVQDALHARAEWQGLALEMQREFGLRLKESLLSNKVIERDGAQRLEIAGAKGGRPRDVEIRTAAQRELVQRVHAHIAQRGQTSLIPADKTLKQGYKAQSNALHRMGATKENRCNSHLARHNYAQERHAGGASRQEIALELGHGRESVCGHYVAN